MSKSKYCIKHGWYTPTRSKGGSVCPRCAEEVEPDLVIDVGTFHCEVRTSLMRTKDLSKLISKSCKYAKELAKIG